MGTSSAESSAELETGTENRKTIKVALRRFTLEHSQINMGYFYLKFMIIVIWSSLQEPPRENTQIV
jgi:hypothetical protein